MLAIVLLLLHVHIHEITHCSCGSDATNRQVLGDCDYLSSYPWYGPMLHISLKSI